MNFLPISILAYALNGGAITIDKILLKSSLPQPITYTFFVNIMQFTALLLIPFGFNFEINNSTYLALASGATSFFALFALFTSLRLTEASLVGPIVGAANPLFSLILGVLFFNQILTGQQTLAIFILVAGSFILSTKSGSSFFNIDKALVWMLGSGLLFAISYVLLREAFLQTNFITAMVVSRIGAGGLALGLLAIPSLKRKIFQKLESQQKTNIKKTGLLLILGQGMGASSGFLLSYATSLANPALVNSLFGMQSVVILTAAIILYRKYPNLLDERLTVLVIAQKVIGVLVLSVGLYLLAQ